MTNRPRDWRLPDGPFQVDWSHPMTKGLVLATDGQLRDMVAKGPSTVVTGTKPQATPFGGRVRGFGSAVYGVGVSDAVVAGFTSQAVLRTYGVWLYINGDGGNQLGRVFAKDTTTVTEGLNISAIGGPRLTYSRGYSTTALSYGYARPANNVWTFVSVSYDSSSLSNIPAMYFNGIAQAPAVTTAPSGTIVNTADAWAWGNRTTDNARTWDGMLGYGVVFDRLLSANDHYALWNPSTRGEWMIRPGQRTSFMVPSAVAASFIPAARQFSERSLRV